MVAWQAFGKDFHAACFACIDCTKQCRAIEFYDYDGRPCCRDCHDARERANLPHCSACQGTITGKFVKLAEGDQCLHDRCFRCAECRTALSGRPYISDDVEARSFFCQDCYHRANGPVCAGCNTVIMPSPTENAVRYLCLEDSKFHVDCFKCHECNVTLASGQPGSVGEPAFLTDGRLCCPSHDPTTAVLRRYSPGSRSSRGGSSGSSKRSSGKRVSFLLDAEPQDPACASSRSGDDQGKNFSQMAPPPLPLKLAEVSSLQNGAATTGYQELPLTNPAAPLAHGSAAANDDAAYGPEYAEAPSNLIRLDSGTATSAQATGATLTADGSPAEPLKRETKDIVETNAAEHIYGFPEDQDKLGVPAQEPIYDDVACEPQVQEAPPALPPRRYTMVPRAVSPNPLGSPTVRKRRENAAMVSAAPKIDASEPSGSMEKEVNVSALLEEERKKNSALEKRLAELEQKAMETASLTPVPPPPPAMPQPPAPAASPLMPGKILSEKPQAPGGLFAAVRQGVALRSADESFEGAKKMRAVKKAQGTASNRFSFGSIFANGMPQLRRTATVGRQA